MANLQYYMENIDKSRKFLLYFSANKQIYTYISNFSMLAHICFNEIRKSMRRRLLKNHFSKTPRPQTEAPIQFAAIPPCFFHHYTVHYSNPSNSYRCSPCLLSQSDVVFDSTYLFGYDFVSTPCPAIKFCALQQHESIGLL